MRSALNPNAHNIRFSRPFFLHNVFQIIAMMLYSCGDTLFQDKGESPVSGLCKQLRGTESLWVDNDARSIHPSNDCIERRLFGVGGLLFEEEQQHKRFPFRPSPSRFFDISRAHDRLITRSTYRPRNRATSAHTERETARIKTKAKR
jgi:hypothetical protein